MRKAVKGDRVKVISQGLTVVGTVESADNEYKYAQGQPPEVIGYRLEIRGDDGLPYYWKSMIDGGSIEFLDPDYLHLLAEYAVENHLLLAIDLRPGGLGNLTLRAADGDLIACASVTLFGLDQATKVAWAQITEEQ